MYDPDCVFCKIVRGLIPSSQLFEDDRTLAFLDIAPFEKGHALVVPKFHAALLTDLPQEEIQPLFTAVRQVARLLLDRLPCDGFNLVQNNGACATQVVPHVHIHVIPRWNGRPLNWTPRAYESPAELAALQQRLCPGPGLRPHAPAR